MPAPSAPTTRERSPPDPASEWLTRFHKGDRETLATCYREHFDLVDRSVRPVVSGADRETVIHELFARLLATEELRCSFRGGSFGAWLTVVARNHAIDYRRRWHREAVGLRDDQLASAAGPTESWEEEAHARVLIDGFKKTVPQDWLGVFELRFLQQLPQREAARRLAMHRTTLAYREIRIRRLLRRHFLSGRKP